MESLHTPDQFTSKWALIAMGFIGFALAYLLITRAFDTGSWWQYFGTVVLFVLSYRLLARSVATRK